MGWEGETPEPWVAPRPLTMSHVLALPGQDPGAGLTPTMEAEPHWQHVACGEKSPWVATVPAPIHHPAGLDQAANSAPAPFWRRLRRACGLARERQHQHTWAGPHCVAMAGFRPAPHQSPIGCAHISALGFPKRLFPWGHDACPVIPSFLLQGTPPAQDTHKPIPDPRRTSLRNPGIG